MTIPALDDGEPMTVAHSWRQWTRGPVLYWRIRIAGSVYARRTENFRVFFYSGRHGWVETANEGQAHDRDDRT